MLEAHRAKAFISAPVECTALYTQRISSSFLLKPLDFFHEQSCMIYLFKKLFLL